MRTDSKSLVVLLIMLTLLSINTSKSHVLAREVYSESYSSVKSKPYQITHIAPKYTTNGSENYKGFNWNNFWKSPVWNAIGALGQWFGALATTAAVIVALKTARDASSIRVKVSATIGFITQGPSTSETMVFFSACNVGQRVVRLTSMGIILPNNKQLVFPNNLSGALPADLQESQETQFCVPIKNLAVSLAENGFSGKVNLRIYFSDSHDVRHWKKWKFNVDGWLK